MRARAPWIDSDASEPRLESGSRVAVVGGGPAGSFFSYFLLKKARAMGISLELDIYEPRDFSRAGPPGCNMCGGVISESLLDTLTAEGIGLWEEVVQCSIDSYALHTDVGTARIDSPAHERRISVVYRGSGPKGRGKAGRSLDAHLLGLATGEGARLIADRVSHVTWTGNRPQVHTRHAPPKCCDLLVVAHGLNHAVGHLFVPPLPGYVPPRTTRAVICELHIGRERIAEHLGTAMHVYLLNVPHLYFAAMIPKNEHVTVCLLGHEVDPHLLTAFLESSAVRASLPQGWRPPLDFCHCMPLINIGAARQPFADRLVFVGDCASTRLYKDGIGAAYRTGRVAAETSLHQGVSASAFRDGYWPVCEEIIRDNRYGRLIFAITRHIRKTRHDQRGLIRMVRAEQEQPLTDRPMSRTLWDSFTGAAPYRDVFWRTLHPGFVARSICHGFRGFWPLKETSPAIAPMKPAAAH